MRDPVIATRGWSRVRAFGFDYLLILGYMAALGVVGTFLTLGPVGGWWSSLMSACGSWVQAGPVSACVGLSFGPASSSVLGLSWLLVAIYLLGLTPVLGRRTLYDRIAGSTVVATDSTH